MQYDDLDIEITNTHIKIFGQNIGEDKANVNLDNEAVLQGYLPLLYSKQSASDRVLEAFGTLLYKTLFLPNIDSAFRSALNIARSNKRGVRLRLNIENEQLKNLPLEYLYLPGQNYFLAISPEIVVSRYFPLARAKHDLKSKLPLKLLV